MIILKPIIKLENVCKYYYSNNTVTMGLNKINLEFSKGEFVAITGESGSGKTTLLNVIAGLDTYEDGELLYKGDLTSHFDADDWEEYRKNQISFIFQNYNLIDSYTALENVMTVLLIQGYTKEEANEKALALLDQVGILERKDNRATQLSSGQKQRLAIARALAKNTDIIVADEPTGNLDVENGDAILKLLGELSKEKLVLLVTHNYEQAEKYVTRKIRLFDGVVKSDVKVNKKSKKEIEEKVEVKRDINNFKIASLFTKMNIKAQPRRVLSIFTLSLFSAITVFTCVGLYASKYDLSLAKEYNDAAFFNGDKTRLIAVRDDLLPINEEDVEKIYNVSSKINSVDLYGLSNDIFYFTDKELKYIYNVEEGPGAGPAKEYLIFQDYSKFVKSETCIDESDLKAGRMPESRLEIVLYGEDEELIGTTKKIYLSNGRNWGTTGDSSNNYCYEFEIVGLLKKETEQIYFDESFAKSLASSVVQQRNILTYVYRFLGNQSYQTVTRTHVFFVINDELHGNEIRMSQELIDASGLFSDNKVIYPDYADSSVITFDNQKYVIKILEEGHSSSDKVLEISPELFETFYGDFNNQVSIYIDDYAYTSSVIAKLAEEGYRAVSVFKVSTIKWDYEKVIVRYLTLAISSLVIIVVSILEIVISKALLKFKKNDFIIFRSLGMGDNTVRLCNYLELFVYAIASIVITILGFNIAAWCGVTFIYDILKFVNIWVYLIYILIVFGVTFIMGRNFNKYLTKQLKSVISLKED